MQLRRQWFINCRCLRHQKQNTGFGRLRNLWGHTLNAFLNWGTATSEIFLCHFFLDQNSAFFVLFLLPRISASSHRLARVSPYYITTRTFHSEIWVRIGITKQVLIDHDWYAYILVTVPLHLRVPWHQNRGSYCFSNFSIDHLLVT